MKRTASRWLAASGGACESRSAPARRGFTLVELLMSLVMVLLLTLAVTQIFRVTTSTIGKGNATGEVIRGLDAMRIALQIDFTGTDRIGYGGLTDDSGILPADRQPAIIISSSSVPAFMSERDMQGDEDYDPTGAFPYGIDTFDSNNDGVDDLALHPYNLGQRWFRTDTISFFTAGHGESQKNLDPVGNGFYGDTSGDESWVWYGHGRVYDGQGELNTNNTNQYPLPGEGTADLNPHNFFASQFVLLRTAILLKNQQAFSGASETTVLNDQGQPVLHLRPDTWDPALPSANLTYPTGMLDLSPLVAFDSWVEWMDPTGPLPLTNEPYPQPAPDTFAVEDSRVDVAGVTPEQYRQRLAAAQRHGTVITGSADANGPLHFAAAAPRAASPQTWYNRLFARTNGNQENQNAGRFWINPLVIKPLNAGEVSQASSYLLGGAAQFIAEYAGDFLTQDLIGATTGNLPDGIIDFTVDASGTRHVRFYGMPRDVDGRVTYASGDTLLLPGPAAVSIVVNMPGSLPDSNALLTSTDTRPLADYLLSANNMSVNTGFPFEKRLPGDYDASDTVGGRNTIEDYEASFLAGDITDWSYLVAWGPGDFDGNTGQTLPLYPNVTHNSTFTSAAHPSGSLRPSLIRVIVQGIDRQTRLEEPLSMELIFRVPAD